jgi:hypothetical protein
MPSHLSRTEVLLSLALLALAVVAVLAPPLAQPAHYHHFADQRDWLGIPCAYDVLSNLAFALFGGLGLWVLARVPALVLAPPQRALAALFFGGLVLTTLCSAWYHVQPDDAGLVVDRLGMTVAFAGLLGLGVASQLRERAGIWLALAVLLLGTLSVAIWAYNGNLLPWALLQGGGMVLLLGLALAPALPGALAVRWGVVVGLYVLAKGLELADHAVFDLSGQLVAGHSLKHLVAACAAWPVIGALQALGQNADQR